MHKRLQHLTLYLLIALSFSVVRPVIAQVSHLATGVWTLSCTGRLMRLPIPEDPNSSTTALQSGCASCVLCTSSADATPTTEGWPGSRVLTNRLRTTHVNTAVMASATVGFQARAP